MTPSSAYLRRAMALSAALMALGSMMPGSSGAQALQLPNLSVLEPPWIAIAARDDDFERALRFDTVVLNAADHPLDLQGDLDRRQNPTTMFASQCVSFDPQGLCTARQPTQALLHFYDPADTALSLFFSDLQCWSLIDAARYELRRRSGEVIDMSPGGLVVSTMASYYFEDSKPRAGNAEDVATEGSYLCASMARQGISAGWLHHRDSEERGQFLDIRNVGGSLALIITVDPTNVIAETNESDNTTIFKLQVSGQDVEIIE